MPGVGAASVAGGAGVGDVPIFTIAGIVEAGAGTIGAVLGAMGAVARGGSQGITASDPLVAIAVTGIVCRRGYDLKAGGSRPDTSPRLGLAVM